MIRSCPLSPSLVKYLTPVTNHEHELKQRLDSLSSLWYPYT